MDTGGTSVYIGALNEPGYFKLVFPEHSEGPPSWVLGYVPKGREKGDDGTETIEWNYTFTNFVFSEVDYKILNVDRNVLMLYWKQHSLVFIKPQKTFISFCIG